jgi:hypothetical protein
MNEIVPWIIGVGGAVVLPLAWLGWKHAAKTWIAEAVTTRWDRERERYRHELRRIEQEAGFDYQRRLLDFNLYSAKRHEACAGLWKRVRRADGRIRELAGMREVPSLEYLDSSDLDKLLERKGLPAGKRKQHVSLWEADPAAAKQSTYELLHELDVQEAWRSWVYANNFLLSNEPYLPEAVILPARDVLTQLKKLFAMVRFQIEGEVAARLELKKQATPMMERLRLAILTSLARGSDSGPGVDLAAMDS